MYKEINEYGREVGHSHGSLAAVDGYTLVCRVYAGGRREVVIDKR